VRTPSARSSDFLTVEEAARVLRIGRTAAYALARAWRETNGREGLPVVEFGRLLRVPRAALEELSGAPITTPVAQPSDVRADVRAPVVDPIPPTRAEPSRPGRRARRRTRSVPPNQTVLPFD
jgi:excisionase family DNA binding protein